MGETGVNAPSIRGARSLAFTTGRNPISATSDLYEGCSGKENQGSAMGIRCT